MQLPKTLPDETLFSRIVRHLTLSGELKDQCLKSLVGSRRAVIHPYLTADLSVISRFTGESVLDLCNKQTLRPWFAYYLSRHQETICDCSIGSNKLLRACQLSTFREREPLTVKYCTLCASEDLKNLGVAYWHLQHQIPGIDVCSIHGIWLSHFNLIDREHLRVGFLPTPSGYRGYCEPLAIQFAQFAERKLRFIQEGPRGHYNSDLYKAQLVDRGFATNTERIKRIELMKSLYSLSDKILSINNPLRITSEQDFRYISSLLNGAYQVHPFKHLLLEFLLSQTPSSENVYEGAVESSTKEQGVNELEYRCCDLLLNGSSIAQVSRAIDKSRCYVKAIALKHHIPVNLKPYKITDSVKDRVSRMAYKGVHRSVIASKIGISSGSVEMIISSIEGLVEWRKKCKADSKRRRYQCQVLRYLQRYPQSIRQSVKQECKAAFFWLYSNNPDWLEQHLPSPQKTNHVDRVNWNVRDIEISEKIVSILELADHILSRTEVDRELGGHGWLTSKKDKLPLSLQTYYQWIKSNK